MNNKPITNIRLATKDDSSAIATIHVLSWQKAYRGQMTDAILDALSINTEEKKWRKSLHQSKNIFVIEQKNCVVGYTRICSSSDEDSAEIAAFYLHPEYWRQGLGKKLYHHCLSIIKNVGYQHITVWVLKTNLRARKFYEAMGFRETKHTRVNPNISHCSLTEVRYHAG